MLRSLADREGRAIGQVRQGSATTTQAIRRAMQHGRASLGALAKRDGINSKAVAKRKRCCPAADLPTGPREPRYIAHIYDALPEKRHRFAKINHRPDQRAEPAPRRREASG